MSIHIDEVSTLIEPAMAGAGGGSATAGNTGSSEEVQLEELRPLVRALIAEELERWFRSRGGLP